MTGTRATLLSLLLVLTTSSAVAVEPSRYATRRLFRPPSILQVSVSPTGDWIVAHGLHDERHGLLVQRRGSGGSVAVHSSRDEIRWVTWIGPDTALLLYRPNEFRAATAIRLRWQEGAVEHESLNIRSGELVDSLPGRDEEVLWSRWNSGGSAVYRGAIASVAPGRGWKSERGEGAEAAEVARLDGEVTRWVADADAAIRAALLGEGEWPDREVVLRVREAGSTRWREIWRSPALTNPIVPLSFSEDGERLVVATHAGQDTLGLHELSIQSGELIGALFVHPDLDVVDAVVDDRRRLIAAIYEEGGLRRVHYLDELRKRFLAGLTGMPGDESIEITGASSDLRVFSLLSRGSRNPGTFYFYDRKTGESEEVGSVIPGLSKDALSPIEPIAVTTEDGRKIEAFLAAGGTPGQRPPLFVLPHGGPIAVRDDAYFDPLLQLISMHGIAVLKVNYRGSAGYGKRFLEAGKREWARGIEDDIEAAVREVIGRGLVDPDRICIGGASYGGYSSLMSAVRSPGRYRCVATLNGPTDLLLSFQSSDFALTEQGRRGFAEIVGDPDEELEELVEISPVYRAHEIRAPVLIAHGAQDIRVDPDHSHRLRAMLDLYDRPYEWIEFERSGHTPSARDYESYAWRLLGFLQRHLEPASEASP